MRLALPLILLASCAAPPETEREDPSGAALLLNHADPDRREEAVARLSILGYTLSDALGSWTLVRQEEDTASLRTGLREAMTEPSPERRIWRAWHLLRRGCLAREGKQVAAALGAQGFRLIEIYEPNESVKFTRYRAQPAAYIDGAGGRHDLFCWTQAVKRADNTWIVREVYVGLHVKVDAPFKSAAAIERHPRGSVLARFFEIPDLQKVALVFPVLEEIEFTYGRIRDKAAESAPAGFHVNAGFVMEKKEGGRSVYYTAESGLDPRERRGGKLDWDAFTRSEETGPLVPRGSGIWGAGGLKPAQED